METWGNLSDNEKQAIRSRARRFTDAEINERFAERDDKPVFRIFRKAEREVPEIPTAVAEAAEERPGVEEVGAREITEVTLISPEDFDYEPDITPADEKVAKPIDKTVSAFASYYAQDEIVSEETGGADMAGLPPRVDHRANQSSVKSQGGRGTCVAHASMAVLEAYSHIPDDLSEQLAHYKFNTFLNRDHDQDAGLRTTDAAPFLARSDGRVCVEEKWPYVPDQSTINQMVTQGTYGPPSAALSDQTYGIAAYKIIPDGGLTGESIKNTRYLETLLHQGYDIVIGTWVSWNDEDNDGILDPVLDSNGKPIGRGGHAMLVVGYDQPNQYFIVKNSWDTTWGHDGYAFFHYDLIRSCFKYGFVVHGVVPTATWGWLKNLWDTIWNWVKSLFGPAASEQ
jgi:C1A family cysteine protease